MFTWGVWLGGTDWGVCTSRDIHGLQLVIIIILALFQTQEYINVGCTQADTCTVPTDFINTEKLVASICPEGFNPGPAFETCLKHYNIQLYIVMNNLVKGT